MPGICGKTSGIGEMDISCEICGTSTVAIFRTSPKGTPFKGRCELHLETPPDPVVLAVTEAVKNVP